MVWRPSDTFWRAAGTALSGSFTSSQRSAVGGGRSLRADTTRCSTCRKTSLNVGSLVHPAALAARLRPYFLDCLPEAKRPVGDREFRRHRKPTPLQIKE